MQGARKLRSEAHLQVRRNDEVEAQRRRWTFYETIKNGGLEDGKRHQKQAPFLGTNKGWTKDELFFIYKIIIILVCYE
jgi:hypothetical protein